MIFFVKGVPRGGQTGQVWPPHRVLRTRVDDDLRKHHVILRCCLDHRPSPRALVGRTDNVPYPMHRAVDEGKRLRGAMAGTFTKNLLLRDRKRRLFLFSVLKVARST